MSSEAILQRIANEIVDVKAHVIALDSRFAKHEIECNAYRQRMMADRREQRRRLNSVSDEVEDTKSHYIKISRIPGNIALWALRVFLAALFAGVGAAVAKLVWGHL